jgi:hypothetical protein
MNRTHAWDSAIWRDTIPTQPGLLTEQHLDTRIRERAAAMEIADQLEREARREWPARRAAAMARCSGPCNQGRQACQAPQACQQAEDDDAHDNLRPARGLVAALLITVVCILLGMALAGCYGGGGDEAGLLRELPPVSCQERPQACR